MTYAKCLSHLGSRCQQQQQDDGMLMQHIHVCVYTPTVPPLLYPGLHGECQQLLDRHTAQLNDMQCHAWHARHQLHAVLCGSWWRLQCSQRLRTNSHASNIQPHSLSQLHTAGPTLATMTTAPSLAATNCTYAAGDAGDALQDKRGCAALTHGVAVCHVPDVAYWHLVAG